MPLGVYVTERKRRNLSLSFVFGLMLLYYNQPVGFVFVGAATVVWIVRRSTAYAKRWKIRLF